jgi:glyoxylase-like metal-dependent hydrolase (beta-lactamase superfamily II)
MLEVEAWKNSPVPSNTYVIKDNQSNECIIIDPGTKDCQNLIQYLISNNLKPKYIFLTHGDFDHIWGVNTLVASFPNIQLVASQEIANTIAIPKSYFSSLYFNSPDSYSIDTVDIIVGNEKEIKWLGNSVYFIKTPGHTPDSCIILVNNWIFSGDTILKDTKPYIKKRNGGDLIQFKRSVNMVLNRFGDDTLVYPGHGDSFNLGCVRLFYEQLFNL